MNKPYTQKDIEIVKTSLKPALDFYQLSKEAYNGIISDLSYHFTKHTDNRESLLTVAETMKILKISKPTVFKLINAGKLNRVKLGSATRIPEKDVIKLIEGVGNE